MPGDLTLSWFAHFCYTQLFVSVPVPQSSYAGKTVIVTGANSGIGFEAARWFARLHVSKLILAVRSPSKGEAAKAAILASTTSPDTTIEVWELDLASHESVRSFAKRAQKLERIDVLLCNAAVATQRWQVAEVNELCITVNVISTMLLAFLLLPKLKATAAQFNTRPHLTFVSSPGHYFVDFKEKDDPAGIFAGLRDEKKADMIKRYSTSKLLAVYIVREMAARRPVDTYPVTINMVDPGLCRSGLNREPDLGTSI